MNKQSNKIYRKIEILILDTSIKCISRYRIYRYRLFKLQNHMREVEETNSQKEREIKTTINQIS